MGNLNMSKVVYDAGRLARLAFFEGRGIAENQKLTEEDLAAFDAFTETDGFSILIKRIEDSLEKLA